MTPVFQAKDKRKEKESKESKEKAGRSTSNVRKVRQEERISKQTCFMVENKWVCLKMLG